MNEPQTYTIREVMEAQAEGFEFRTGTVVVGAVREEAGRFFCDFTSRGTVIGTVDGGTDLVLTVTKCRPDFHRDILYAPATAAREAQILRGSDLLNGKKN